LQKKEKDKIMEINFSSLNEELKNASKEIDACKLARYKDGVKIVIEEIKQDIEPLNFDFGSMKIQKQDLMNLVAKQIARACNGRMLIPHMALAKDKTSPVWIYVGTHWEEIPDTQIFYDFVSEACLKMGLSEDLADNVTFFKDLCKVVEKKLSKYPRMRNTDGIVLVPMLNGVLEIDSEGHRLVRPHRREDFLRYVLPFNYDETAQCPRFMTFLDEVLPNKDVQLVVLEYFAYCLVPWLHIEKLMAFLGGGSNGKSKLLEVLEGLFGKSSVAHESLHDLTYDATHRANIEGKLVNICTENEGKIKGSILRTMVSGETITCKKLYSQPYETNNYGKLLFAFNEMPNIKSTEANMRRWILVKFNVHITEEQADTELGEKLAKELPGILNLVLSVLPDLLKRKKFTKCDTIDNAVKELEYENDPVMQFVSQRCEANNSYKTKASDLFKCFCEFCIQNNIPNELKNQGFYKRLEALGHQGFMENNQKNYPLRIVRYED